MLLRNCGAQSLGNDYGRRTATQYELPLPRKTATILDDWIAGEGGGEGEAETVLLRPLSLSPMEHQSN